MSNMAQRGGLSWAGRLMVCLALMLVGAAATAWALARHDGAARLLGVAPAPVAERTVVRPILAPSRLLDRSEEPDRIDQNRIAELEARLERVESAAERVEGSAGRADGLLVAFAARRAIERGMELGYLEPLLIDRFGPTHSKAVGTIVSGARAPVRLSELTDEYRRLGPQLRSGAAEEGWWAEVQRELGSLIAIRQANRPNINPDARYNRALDHLADGEVDQALAETMRLPGARRASDWAAKARRYVAIQRALDEIETAALLGRMRRTAA